MADIKKHRFHSWWLLSKNKTYYNKDGSNTSQMQEEKIEIKLNGKAAIPLNYQVARQVLPWHWWAFDILSFEFHHRVI